MLVRLNASLGFVEPDPKTGEPAGIILDHAYRYHGMVAGFNAMGRLISRPLLECEFVSQDSIEWHPMSTHKETIPLQGSTYVRESEVHRQL